MTYLAVTADRQIAGICHLEGDAAARTHFRAVRQDLLDSHTDRQINPQEWERDVARWQAWEMDGRRVCAPEVLAEELSGDPDGLRRLHTVLAWTSESEELRVLCRQIGGALWPAAQGVTL